jgi:hypothetical protein
LKPNIVDGCVEVGSVTPLLKADLFGRELTDKPASCRSAERSDRRQTFDLIESHSHGDRDSFALRCW